MENNLTKLRDELAKEYLGNYCPDTDSGWTKMNDFSEGFDAALKALADQADEDFNHPQVINKRIELYEKEKHYDFESWMHGYRACHAQDAKVIAALRAENSRLRNDLTESQVLNGKLCTRHDEELNEAARKSIALIDKLRAELQAKENRIKQLEDKVHEERQIHAKQFDIIVSEKDRRIAELEAALKFYATFGHFEYCGNSEGEPETVSGEPENWLAGDGEFNIENGGVARKALQQGGKTK